MRTYGEKIVKTSGVEISKRYHLISNGKGCSGGCSLTGVRNTKYKACINGRGNPRFTGQNLKEIKYVKKLTSSMQLSSRSKYQQWANDDQPNTYRLHYIPVELHTPVDAAPNDLLLLCDPPHLPKPWPELAPSMKVTTIKKYVQLIFFDVVDSVSCSDISTIKLIKLGRIWDCGAEPEMSWNVHCMEDKLFWFKWQHGLYFDSCSWCHGSRLFFYI